MNIDYKFHVPLAVSVIGVLVAAWFAVQDWRAPSLAAQVISSTDLSSAVSEEKIKIELLVDGQKIDSPYLTVIGLRNSGSKPIPKANFEGPITIELDESIEIISANTDAVVPENLPVVTGIHGKSIRVDPLLLNPGDSMKISFVTAGGVPKPRFGARISGVQEIEIESAVSPIKFYTYAIFNGSMAFLMFFLYVMFAGRIWIPKAIQMTRKSAVTLCLGCLLSGAVFLGKLNSLFEAEIGFVGLVIVITVFYACASLLVSVFDRPSSKLGDAG